MNCSAGWKALHGGHVGDGGVGGTHGRAAEVDQPGAAAARVGPGVLDAHRLGRVGLGGDADFLEPQAHGAAAGGQQDGRGQSGDVEQLLDGEFEGARAGQQRPRQIAVEAAQLPVCPGGMPQGGVEIGHLLAGRAAHGSRVVLGMQRDGQHPQAFFRHHHAVAGPVQEEVDLPPSPRVVALMPSSSVAFNSVPSSYRGRASRLSSCTGGGFSTTCAMYHAP